MSNTPLNSSEIQEIIRDNATASKDRLLVLLESYHAAFDLFKEIREKYKKFLCDRLKSEFPSDEYTVISEDDYGFYRILVYNNKMKDIAFGFHGEQGENKKNRVCRYGVFGGKGNVALKKALEKEGYLKESTQNWLSYNNCLESDLSDWTNPRVLSNLAVECKLINDDTSDINAIEVYIAKAIEIVKIIEENC